jgi:polyhydroxyalkanoate synthesis regulator phasin
LFTFTYLLEIIMDQLNMLSIVGSIYDKLVADVADSVICRLKAEALGTLTLEPEKLQFAMLHLLESDTLIREEVLNISEETFNKIDTRLDHIENDDNPSCNVDISDNDDFTDLKAEVESLKEQVEALEATPVDADNDDFQDAVRSVIRNHI